jgi:NADH-ubiquinone oxidoreductase chain 3
MINLVTTYQEKYSAYESGFHSFAQSRSQFNIAFFIYGFLFLLLDLEILLIYPYAASSYENGPYGLILSLIFITLVTIGFIFELGKDALTIPTRQDHVSSHNKNNIVISHISPLQEGGNSAKEVVYF